MRQHPVNEEKPENEKIKRVRPFFRRLKPYIKTMLLCVTNPRLLLCLGIAWFVTNGWSYVLMAVGTFFQIEWMMAVAGAYLAFLWLPVSPEKIVTLALAVFLLKRLFPQDKKTLGVLHELHMKAKGLHDRRKRNKNGDKR
ncbi:MAG: hypothetical protein ACI3XM_11070 [Eubacteriales bacterium]